MLTLALGIGAGIAAFSVLDAVRFRALPFPAANRLVLLSEVPVERAAAAPNPADCEAACDVSYETYANLLRTHAFQTLDVVTGYTSGLKALNRGGDPILVLGGVASPELFELLHARPILGRLFTAEDDRLDAAPVVLLSHDLWTEHFARDPAILGQTVKLSDTRYTVIGVMPPGFTHEVRSRFWLPVVPTLDPSTRPSIRSLTVIGRLRPGRTLAQLRAELATLDPAALSPAGPGGRTPVRLEAVPLRVRYSESTRSHDLAFAAVVLCVVFLAGANLATLVLGRTLYQRREFAVRSTLGASTGRLVRVLLTQHALLVTAGMLLGLFFAAWLLRVLASLEVLDSLRPPGMEYRLDLRATGFAVALGTFLALGLSLVPAGVVRGARLEGLLRDSGAAATLGRGSRLLQQALVVAQIAAAVVLLTGAGLMTRTVWRLSRTDLGFDPTPLVQGTPSYPHPWRMRPTYLPVSRRILAELAALPGVRAAVLRADVPLAARGATPAVTLAGQAEPLPAALAPAVVHGVSPGYFEALGVRIIQGRALDDRDTENGVPVAVVNEWAARRWWPGEDPVGRTVRVDSAPGQGVELTIVGVAADNLAALPGLLLATTGAELYRPFEQASSAFPTFYVEAAGAPAALLRPVRELLVREVPDRPVSTGLVADQVADQLRGVRLNAIQLLAFALVGVGLALTGMYGVLANAVGRRTRELGIRGALGASPPRLAGLVLGEAALLLLAGLALGYPLAGAAARLLGGLLHGTRPTDGVVQVGVAVATVGVAAFASWLPARRAMSVDPAEALRAH